MGLREGFHASYIGQYCDDLEVGDRCLILSSERNYADVKWVTGKRAGLYDRIENDDLVADRPPARFEDEFTFESYSNRLVNVACAEVLEKRGKAALFRAISQDGHLTDVSDSAIGMVSSLRQVLLDDNRWGEVVDDLSQPDAVEFEKYALRKIVEQALNEVEHGIL